MHLTVQQNQRQISAKKFSKTEVLRELTEIVVPNVRSRNDLQHECPSTGEVQQMHI